MLFTHDAPAQVQNLKSAMTLPPDLQRAAGEVRRLLAEAVEHTDPAYVLHGHWHQHNHEQIGGSTEVFGLSADGIPQQHRTAHDPPGAPGHVHDLIRLRLR